MDASTRVNEISQAFQAGDAQASEALTMPLLRWFSSAFRKMEVDPRRRPKLAAEAFRRAFERREQFDPFDEEARWGLVREAMTASD